MMSLSKLVRKYGNQDKIPPEELELEGFVRYKGRVVSIDRLNERQLAQALGIHELEEETEEARLENKIEEAQRQINSAFQGLIGQYLPVSFRERLSREVEKWIDDSIEQDYFKSVDDINIRLAPHVGFVLIANQYLQTREFNPNIIPGALEKRWEELEGHLPSDGPITLDHFDKVEDDYLMECQKSMSNVKGEDYPAEAQKFEEKYGSIHFCGGGPFRSYLFRSVVLGEEDPQEFWGMRLFGLHKKLIDELGGSDEVKEFANLVYSDECSYAGEKLFDVRWGTDGIFGRKGIRDELPEAVEEFESRRASGAAIAFIRTEGYHIDEDYLSGNRDLRDLLKKVHEAEFGTEARDKVFAQYEGITRLVKNESKKMKIIRLVREQPDFEDLVRAYSEQRGEEFVDGLRENQGVSEELNSLSIDADVFYRGTSAKEFVVEGGMMRDKADIRTEYMEMYRNALHIAFSPEVVNGTDRLEQKVADTLRKHKKDIEIPEDTPLIEYVSALDDDNLIRRVCNVTSEYISRKQNVNDEQQAGATAHHLRTVSQFMKGKHKAENGDDKSSIYSVRLATKNPLTDVDIGNDGGCCIGIYGAEDADYDPFEDVCNPERFISYLEEGVLFAPISDNGVYMPFYLKDRATQFVEIYKRKDRVGMALMFAGKNENDESVLIVNSIEMSDRLKQDPNRQQVIDRTIDYIREYARASGFKHTLMGDHSYNPARSAAQKSEIGFAEVKKIHPWNDTFYSDVLRDGKGKTSSFGYL